ncbi:hypothetical protein GF406_02225 [candidate division KSB1 bacterium]|nr:hypothetical protein [candidate division KSB1 bacterium]
MKSLITLCMACLLFANTNAQKVTPPPTRMELPPDSVVIETEEGQTIETKDEQLELPDVVVFGQDRIIRQAGDKAMTQPQKPSLLTPTAAYDPVIIWFDEQTEKPTFDHDLNNLLRSGWVQTQGGSFSTLLIDAGYWQRLQKGNFRLHGWLDRSKGEFNNSQHNLGGASARISYELAPKVTGTMGGHFTSISRGLHGAIPDDFERSGTKGSFHTELIYDVNRLSDGQLGFEIGGMSLQSDTSKVRFDKTSDFWYHLHGSYTLYWQRSQWTLGGSFLSESIETDIDSASIKNTLGEIQLEGLFPLSNKLTVAAGVKYQTNKPDTTSKIDRIAPFARMNIMPSNNIGITLSAQSGLDYTSFPGWWQENPYVTHQIPLRPMDVDVAAKIKSDLRLTTALELSFGLERKWISRMYYWQRIAQNGLFDLRPLDKVQLTEIMAGFNIDINPRTQLEASIIGYSDRVELDGPALSDRLPYRPTFRIPIRVTLQLIEGLVLRVNGDVYGKRPSSLASESRLPSFGLINASLSKDFSRISAIVSVYNIFDSDYVMWENYQEEGVTVLGGLSAKF